MAFNRELSQFANYLELDASANYIGIAAGKDAEVGIGTVDTEAKLTVDGDVKVSGVITATTFDGILIGNADTAAAYYFLLRDGVKFKVVEGLKHYHRLRKDSTWNACGQYSQQSVDYYTNKIINLYE